MPTIYSSSLWLNEIQSFKIQSFVAMHIRWKLIFQLIYFDTRNIKSCFFYLFKNPNISVPRTLLKPQILTSCPFVTTAVQQGPGRPSPGARRLLWRGTLGIGQRKHILFIGFVLKCYLYDNEQDLCDFQKNKNLVWYVFVIYQIICLHIDCENKRRKY